MLFFVQFAVGLFLVLFLPGYVLNLLLFKNERFDLWETIPLAFGSSVALNSLIGLGVFCIYGNITAALAAHVIVTAILVFLCFRQFRKQRPPMDFGLRLVEKKPEWIYAAPFLLLFVPMLFGGYTIEMGRFLGQEDSVTILMAQKMLSLPQWRLDGLMFRPGQVLAYFFSLYSYVLALLSFISQLEVVQVYNKLRVLFCLVSITTVYALVRALFPALRELAHITAALVCVLVWTGWGTQYVSGMAFSQFFPMTQYYDYAICVLLPLALLFFLRGLQGRLLNHLFCLLISISLFFIHGREAVVALVMFFSLMIAAMFNSNQKRANLFSALLVILGLAVAGLVFKFVQSNLLVDYVLQASHDQMSYAKSIWAGFLTEGNRLDFLYPPLSDNNILNSYKMFAVHPYYVLTAFLLPLLLWRRRVLGLGALSWVMVPGLFVSFIPLFSLVFIQLTYSTILFGAPMNLGLFPVAYLVLGLLVWILLDLAARLEHRSVEHGLNPLLSAGGMAGLVLALALIIHLPRFLHQKWPVFYFSWVFVGSILVFIASFFTTRRPNSMEGSLLTKSKICSPLLFLLFIPVLFIDPARFISPFEYDQAAKPQSFASLYREARQRPSVADWPNYYEQSCFQHLPWPVIQFIRKNVPPTAVLAAPPENWNLYYLPSLTGVYVYTSGSFNSLLEEEFFDRLYRMRHGRSLKEKMRTDHKFRREYLADKGLGVFAEFPDEFQYYPAMVAFGDELMKSVEAPIFNQFDSIEETLCFIDAFGVDYLLVTPKWLPGLGPRLEASAWFENIYRQNGFAVFKVRPSSTPQEQRSAGDGCRLIPPPQVIRNSEALIRESLKTFFRRYPPRYRAAFKKDGGAEKFSAENLAGLYPPLFPRRDTDRFEVIHQNGINGGLIHIRPAADPVSLSKEYLELDLIYEPGQNNFPPLEEKGKYLTLKVKCRGSENAFYPPLLFIEEWSADKTREILVIRAEEPGWHEHVLVFKVKDAADEMRAVLEWRAKPGEWLEVQDMSLYVTEDHPLSYVQQDLIDRRAETGAEFISTESSSFSVEGPLIYGQDHYFAEHQDLYEIISFRPEDRELIVKIKGGEKTAGD